MEHELFQESRFIHTDAALPDGEAYKWWKTKIKANTEENTIFIEGTRTKQFQYGLELDKRTNWLRAELDDWEDLSKILEFLNAVDEQRGSGKMEMTIDIVDGECKDVPEDRHERGFDELKVQLAEDGKYIQFYLSPHITLPIHVFEESVNKVPQDSQNLQELQLFFADMCGARMPDPLLDSEVDQNIRKADYGDEIINHIADGDQCYRYELWHSALSSYIRAFEWAMIAYLEDQEGVDVIEQERKDEQTYYFTTLLDTLQEHVNVDQKTDSRLRSMNRAERRWMAHHKSGSTLPEEVDAIRSRLQVFLNDLFE